MLLPYNDFQIKQDEYGCVWIVRKSDGAAFASQTSLAWMCEISQADVSNIVNKTKNCPKSLISLDLSGVIEIENNSSGINFDGIPVSICYDILVYFAHEARGSENRKRAKLLVKQIGNAGTTKFVHHKAEYKQESQRPQLHNRPDVIQPETVEHIAQLVTAYESYERIFGVNSAYYAYTNHTISYLLGTEPKPWAPLKNQKFIDVDIFTDLDIYTALSSIYGAKYCHFRKADKYHTFTARQLSLDIPKLKKAIRENNETFVKSFMQKLIDMGVIEEAHILRNEQYYGIITSFDHIKRLYQRDAFFPDAHGHDTWREEKSDYIEGQITQAIKRFSPNHVLPSKDWQSTCNPQLTCVEDEE